MHPFSRQAAPRLSILFIIVLYCGIPLYPWQSLPGGGLNRTVNMLTWLFVCAWMLGLSRLLSRRPWANKTVGLLLAGFLLLNLPVIWTPPVFLPDALCRLAGTAALAGLLWLLLPLPVRGGLRRAVYVAIVAAGVLQSALAGWQVLLPQSAADWLGYDFVHASGRATGGFGQANLLGSFLATGLLCTLWLMLSAPRLRWRRLAAAGAMPLLAGLMLSESRSAWLGAALGAGVLMLCASSSRQRLQILGILAVGLLAGTAASSLRPSAVIAGPQVGAEINVSAVTVNDRLASTRAASGRERLALTEGVLSLIADHPLVGNGIGSFESALPHALARSGRVNPFPVTVAHPHNELLYVWSEGGIVALGGLLCWLVLWSVPLRSAPNLLRQHHASRHVIARGTLTLPLMVHVMSEFPFYLSAAHGVLMVVLLWLALPATSRQGCRFRGLSATRLRPAQALVVTLCLGGMVFMATGLQSAFCIQASERSLFSDETPLAEVINPLAQFERLQFDRAEENLMRFNASRNGAWLYRFQRQAAEWLDVHNDASLTDAMMRISQAQQDRQQAAYWRRRGCMSFHADPRFHCNSTAPDGVEEHSR